MINFRILLFTLITNYSLAANISKKASDVAVYKDDKSIVISGTSCESISKELTNIRRWANKNLNQEKQIACLCEDEYCQADITNEVPEIIKLYEEKRPDVNGPNCWNNTLVTAGILPHYRYSTPEEMSFWMKSPLCRERETSEPMEPGDVIAIRKKDSSESHGFIYISDKMAWSKNGFNKKSIYNTQDLKYVFELYDVEEECQRSSANDKNCNKFANIYKCQSWEDYWSKVDENIKNRVDKDLELSLNTIECSLSESLFNKALIDTQFMDLMFNTLAIVEMLVVDLKEDLKEDATEEERLYIDRSMHRILSIKEQYYIMEVVLKHQE